MSSLQAPCSPGKLRIQEKWLNRKAGVMPAFLFSKRVMGASKLFLKSPSIPLSQRGRYETIPLFPHFKKGGVGGDLRLQL